MIKLTLIENDDSLNGIKARIKSVQIMIIDLENKKLSNKKNKHFSLIFLLLHFQENQEKLN